MATNLTTVTGRLLDAAGEPITNEYVYFRLKTAGADSGVSPKETFARKAVEALTDSSGDISKELWVNGESGIESVYQITTKNDRIEPTNVIIPDSATGSTIDIADLLTLYVVDDSSPQSSTALSLAYAYTDSLAEDPTNNTNFDEDEWLIALGFTSSTPTDGSILKGDGTGWVVASNFKVNTGTLGTGTVIGTGTANGSYALSEGAGTTASGSSSHAEGGGTTASGDYSHAEGVSTTASGDYSHAEGYQTLSSGISSHAEGFQTEASGAYSHAEGYDTESSGDYSSSTGRRARAIHDGARVESDSQFSEVSSTTTDQYTARFQNGYVFKDGDAEFEGSIDAVNGTFSGDVECEDITANGAIYGKVHFILASSEDISISTDIDDPTYIEDFVVLDSYGCSLRASDGSMTNDSGRTLGGVVGNLAMQIEITGGTKTLYFWSESSTDGVTFTMIEGSAREREISNSNESFVSTVSFSPSWGDGNYVRFAFACSGSSMNFTSPSITSNGTTIGGRSIVWELTEQ